MNSVIEAQQEFEECQLRNRLRVLREYDRLFKEPVRKRYKIADQNLLQRAGVVEKGPEVIVKEGRLTWKA